MIVLPVGASSQVKNNVFVPFPSSATLRETLVLVLVFPHLISTWVHDVAPHRGLEGAGVGMLPSHCPPERQNPPHGVCHQQRRHAIGGRVEQGEEDPALGSRIASTKSMRRRFSIWCAEEIATELISSK